jgi:L-asparaginase II
MMAHPFLVAGEGKTTTRFMESAKGSAAVKSGAEGVYVAILPERKLGVALKIVDGAGRAADTAMAALLVRLGVLDANDHVVRSVLNAPILNRAGVEVGTVRAASGIC